MKRFTVLGFILIGFLCILSTHSRGQDTTAQTSDTKESKSITISSDMDFNSRYLWRGISLSKGGVIQRSMTVDWKDFSFEFWNNYNMNKADGENQLNEYDFTLSYNHEFDSGFSLEPAVTYWIYPTKGVPDTGEVSLKLVKSIGDIAVYLKPSVDVFEYPGSVYTELGVDYTKQLNQKMEFTANLNIAAGSANHNQTYFDVHQSAMNLVGGGVGLTYNLTKHISLRPHGEFTSLLDSDLKSSVEHATLFNAGMSVGYGF